MSLWHADRDSNPGKRKVRTLTDLEPLPELDELLDEFDSEKNLIKKNNESVEVKQTSQIEEKPYETKSFSLPSPDEDEFMETESEPLEIPYDEEIEDKHLENEEQLDNEPINHSEEDYNIDDEIENEFEENSNLSDNRDFVDLSEERLEDEEENDEDAFEDLEDEEFIDDEDFTNESLEEDLEGQFGLIPAILDEEESPKEESQEKEAPKQEEKQKEKKKENKGFKELDEEKVKEFFTNIFSKFPNFKKGKSAQKEENESSPKPEKVGNKSKKGLSKKVLISIAVPIFVILLLFIIYSFWVKGYTDVDKLTYSDEDNMKISLVNFAKSEEGLSLNIKNNDDISKGFSFYVTIKQKSAIPFTSSKIECESDIIDITSGDEITEELRCSQPFDENEKYKISNVETIEL